MENRGIHREILHSPDRTHRSVTFLTCPNCRQGQTSVRRVCHDRSEDVLKSMVDCIVDVDAQ